MCIRDRLHGLLATFRSPKPIVASGTGTLRLGATLTVQGHRAGETEDQLQLRELREEFNQFREQVEHRASRAEEELGRITKDATDHDAANRQMRRSDLRQQRAGAIVFGIGAILTVLAIVLPS